MSILFLDDSALRIDAFRTRFPEAEIVETADAAIEALSRDPNYVWAAVWLDHDLTGELMDERDPESGSQVVRWIVRHQPTIVEIYVHTWNPVAGMHMVADLMGAGYVVHRWPFDTTLLFAGADT